MPDSDIGEKHKQYIFPPTQRGYRMQDSHIQIDSLEYQGGR